MTTALTKARRRRSAKKNAANDVKEEINELIVKDFNEEVITHAKLLLESIQDYCTQIEKFNETVFDLIDDDDELNEEEKTARTVRMDLKTVELKLKSYLRKHSEDTSDTVMKTTASSTKAFGLRLPRLGFQNFDGDPIRWRPFIEQFDAAVNIKDDLSGVEKFTYLKSYLEGTALEAVEGLPLTESNYDHARKILTKRFGNTQLIISSHMNNLISLDKVTNANVKDLRLLYDKIEGNVRALDSLGVASKDFGPLLVPIILEKLPNAIRLQVSRSLGGCDWKIDEFLMKINEEITARENYDFLKTDEEEKRDTRNRTGKQIREFEDRATGKYASVGSLTVGHRTVKCAFCRGLGHYADRCNTVTDMKKRVDIVKSGRLCFKCLQPGHGIQNCQSRMKCFKCRSSKHHTAICESAHGKALENNPRNDKVPAIFYPSNDLREVPRTAVTLSADQNSVMLQTVNVVVSDVKDNCAVKCNLIFDGGSQRTYISQRLVEKLKLNSTDAGEMRVSVFGDTNGKLMSVKEYEFCVQGKQGSFYLKGFAVPNICAPLCNQRVDIARSQFKQLTKLIPPEDSNYDDGRIDILVGADYYWSLVTEDIVRLNEKLVAIRSKLGYILSGPVEIGKNRKNDRVHFQNCVHVLKTMNEPLMAVEIERTLDEKVEKFWSLDSIGIAPNEESVYERTKQSIEFVNERYEVKLPFKEEFPILDDNHENCAKRLNSLKKKLQKTPTLLKSYDDIIQKQLKNGIVEMVNENDSSPNVGNVTYLPHRPVVNEKKSTTKIRIVYDASAKAGEFSLNECLYKGECSTPLIFGSLLRFRVHKVALVADIEGAYLQISVTPEQRDFLRFLWFKDITHGNYEILKLRFTRVLFGLAPSQFLLNAVIRRHVEKYNDSEFLMMVLRAFYVDDMATSLSESKKVVDFYWKCKIRFAEGGFNLRKFRTNDIEVKRMLEDNEVQFETNERGKVLGIVWDEVGDCLIIRLGDFLEGVLMADFTKREILRIIARFYDPLVLIQPLIVQLKIIFQKTCKLNLNWDEKVSADIEAEVHRVLREIQNLNQILIPRCYCKNEIENPISRTELIGFSDASPAAYGACVYARFVMKKGDVKIVLLASKSRVAPMKKIQTLPRLELMGNVVLCRLIAAVIDGFQGEITFDDIRCYTDSQICLAWITSVKKEYQTFVQNRVLEIRRSIAREKWSYCSSESNPADLLTKVNAESFSKNETKKMWLEGPIFLYRRSEDIEKFNLERGRADDSLMYQGDDELKQVSIKTCVESKEQITIDKVIDISRYRDLLKLYRITGYVKRFIDNLKRSLNKEETMKTNFLTSKEMKDARLLWMFANQAVLIRDSEFKQLETTLNCKKDKNGLIRCYGRMKNSNLPEITKAPIMLSKEHRLAELIVIHAHMRVLHRGVRQTLSELRATCWITKGRSFVKKILNSCTVCKRLNSRAFAYPGHSDLPSLRFDDRRPFASTGCDYLGPLHVLPVYGRTSTMFKAFVVIYTCAATRGVILEVVNSCNTHNFLQSFRRFIARRGCPALMISDNGSSFVAEETQRFATDRFVDWKFNVAYAPNWGGMWERLVGCVKKCLKKTIGLRQISYIELQTLISEIEAILNNRPLCADYDDDIDDVLTPNHLVFGRRIEMSNRSEEVEEVENYELNRRGRHLNGLLNFFWKVWKNEYLVALRENHKCNRKKGSDEIEVGDIVLIHDDHRPRQLWKFGKVVELLRGKDGVIRAAKLRTGRSATPISRPLYRLYPLESIRRNLEFSNRVESINESFIKDIADDEQLQEDDNEIFENVDDEEVRPKREASVRADLIRKFGGQG